MLKNKEMATAVSLSGEQFIADLNAVLNKARTTCEPEEYQRFLKSVGLVVGTIEVDMLGPLYKQHPDLEPDGLTGTPKADSP
ncbi:MAG: hypothetical protein WAV95_06815 [Azonexus sp.]